jgi:hypothetical protein
MPVRIVAEAGDSQIGVSQRPSEGVGQPTRTPLGCRDVVRDRCRHVAAGICCHTHADSLSVVHAEIFYAVPAEIFCRVRLRDPRREKDRQQSTLVPIQLGTRELAKLLDEAGGWVGIDTTIVAQ